MYKRVDEKCGTFAPVFGSTFCRLNLDSLDYVGPIIHNLITIEGLHRNWRFLCWCSGLLYFVFVKIFQELENF